MLGRRSLRRSLVERRLASRRSIADAYLASVGHRNGLGLVVGREGTKGGAKKTSLHRPWERG